MADFDEAFELMMSNEGGHKLTSIKGDRGGQTYAGISRVAWPYWSGWKFIDNGDLDNEKLLEFVKQFYKENFWFIIKGDEIKLQKIANSIFDFAVNVGSKTAIRKAQETVFISADGVVEKSTLEKWNLSDSKFFCAVFAIHKINYYTGICNKNPSQQKFLLGWINRTVRMALV
jgi:lysozyme family protein